MPSSYTMGLNQLKVNDRGNHEPSISVAERGPSIVLELEPASERHEVEGARSTDNLCVRVVEYN